jgi:putative ABC transport system substrate-binding protein
LKLRFASFILLLAALTASLAAAAQEARKIARIGVVTSVAGDAFVEAFRQGLRELGYVEGQNISIEYRSSEGRSDRLPALFADLVRHNVDVIVAASNAAVAAQRATTTIPIVMPIITDPVRLGLVESLAHPGKNATGFATQNEELPGKWMALVKELLPGVSRVAGGSNSPPSGCRRSTIKASS